MKEYKELYFFDVMEALSEGKDVKMVDREECKVYDVSEMCAGSLSRVMKSKDKGRFVFWSEEPATEGKEV